MIGWSPASIAEHDNNRIHGKYMSNDEILDEPGLPLEFITVKAIMLGWKEKIMVWVYAMHKPSLVCVMEEIYGSDEHNVSWSFDCFIDIIEDETLFI